MRLSWLFLPLLLLGCMSPLPADVDHDGGDEIDVVQPDPLLHDVSTTVTVTASPDAFAAMAAWLGKENTITVKNETTIEQDAVTVNVPAGATVAYTFSDDLGTFTFAKPLPTVKASVLGFKVSPSLSVVTIKPDGSGVAATGLGKYKFRWLAEDDAGVEAPSELPEVWAYSMPGCLPCVRARIELAAEKNLPFRIVWRDEAAPDWLKTRPAFWWHTTGQQPSQADVNNTRQATGWNGIRDFTERWKASRSPKKYSRATSTISHHSGHDCPACGRQQYSIANNEGPGKQTHTHRCDSCGKQWWHGD
jgi:predicted RNA-binding Zn-ribbon protein involved in translation (DUF1610 family)